MRLSLSLCDTRTLKAERIYLKNAGRKNDDRGSIGSLCSLREAAMDMLVVREKEKAIYENKLQKMEAELVEVFILSLHLMKN